MRLKKASVQPATLLLTQLRWFIRLRWIAGATVVAFALVDWWLGWYGWPAGMLLTGLAILLYNVAMHRAAWLAGPARHGRLLALAAAQILLDLGVLTLLTTWTGGIYSPLTGFYMLHMIFASLLLPRRMAYAGVAAAVGLMLLSATASGALPEWTAATWRRFAGWSTSLLLAVYLANQITRALKRQRQRLIRQNRHIRRIGRKLRHHQEMMVRQEKMAALGQMAAGITHEIANPLASMDTLLQVMQRRPERLSAQTVETLRSQVLRVNEIVRQMATFAHPGDGHWQVAPINDVVTPALEMLRYDKRMARVKLVVELDPAAGMARMMTQAMQQVMINLVANALDAMADTAEPRLTIRTQRSSEWCVVKVTDNGHGIRPDHLSRIFEPFFTTKPVGKGTGVGLSITYSLVAKHKGKIDVHSRVGEGTTFEVRLPVAE